MKGALRYFSFGELALWSGSVALITLSFFLFRGESYLTLAASLIGVTSLIFNAKGNPFGQLLMIVFSILYGIISYSFSYYGEMITYLGMTAPMAFFALLSWLRHPYKGNKAQVAVGRLTKKSVVLMVVATLLVTVGFYFILAAFDTRYLFLSTLSVSTSFLAVYLTFKRSPLFALAYAANDLVLISLWVLATLESRVYFSVVICFALFLANDIYGYFSWVKMEKRQKD